MIHPLEQRHSGGIVRLLSGLQAGMLGGILMLTFMAGFSVLDRRAWWSYPNIIAISLDGDGSLGAGLGWHTVSGLALQLLVTSVAGGLFGLMFGDGTRNRRELVYGLVWGASLYLLSVQYYRIFKPLVFAYLPGAKVLVAHMVYGVSLPWMGRLGTAPPRPDFGREVAAVPRDVPSAAETAAGASGPEETEKGERGMPNEPA